MLLVAFNFLQMKVADILDILLLGIIIFLAFRWLRGSSAMSIFVAIVSLYLIRVLVSAFNMRLMTALMETVLDVGVPLKRLKKKGCVFDTSFLYTPKRFRTAVAGMKIPSPGPLDDRGVLCRAKYS